MSEVKKGLFSFKSSNDLSLPPEKPILRCPKCGTFDDMPNMLELLPDNTYYCNFCSNTFSIKTNLK